MLDHESFSMSLSSLNLVGYALCGGGETLIQRHIQILQQMPEKSYFPSRGSACVDKDQTMPTLFFSFGGRPTCISRHRIASSNVNSSSTGFFPLPVQNEQMVSAGRVDLRESSMDVSSIWERAPISSVSYYLRCCIPELLAEHVVWPVFHTAI